VPLYEFLCKKCGHRFERIQKFSDADPKKCPECGGKIERVLHAPAVQFKGAGWYVTDYASKGKSSSKEEGSSDSSATKVDASAGEKKTESKEGKDSSKKTSKEKK
jgi:putative FmdB family regulatory protein